MPNKDNEKSKFGRLFEILDEYRERLVRVEVYEETEKTEISEMRAEMKKLQETMNQLVGKNTVFAGVCGFIGSIVSAIVTFFITRGGAS